MERGIGRCDGGHLSLLQQLRMKTKDNEPLKKIKESFKDKEYRWNFVLLLNVSFLFEGKHATYVSLHAFLITVVRVHRVHCGRLNLLPYISKLSVLFIMLCFNWLTFSEKNCARLLFPLPPKYLLFKPFNEMVWHVKKLLLWVFHL